MVPGAILRVIDPGRGTTIQDLGRRGWSHLGVPTGGPVDRAAHERMNRLVGNGSEVAGLETAGGLVVEARTAAVVARSTDDCRYTLAAGERIRVDAPPGRVWGYLAVRGGVDVEPVLGSRGHDTLSGLGPPPITAGAVLPIGQDPRAEMAAEMAPAQAVSHSIRVWDGPQIDWFARGIAALTAPSWLLTAELSRVGRRLPPGDFELGPHGRHQMRSAGLIAGAVQITPSGGPIVMLANHPTTGGYPVIAVVDPDDLAIVAQSPPGSSVRFVRAQRD